MGKAFFIFDPKDTSISGATQDREDKIIPDPVEMDVNYPIIDGKVVTVTATSGIDQYLIVTSGDYPLTGDQRDRRGIYTK